MSETYGIYVPRITANKIPKTKEKSGVPAENVTTKTIVVVKMILTILRSKNNTLTPAKIKINVNILFIVVAKGLEPL